MSTREEVAQVLDKAHDVLLTHGWRQGGLQDDDGAVCLAGAISVTCDLRDKRGGLIYPDETAGLGCSAFDALTVAVRAIGSDGPVSFNDAPDRTEDEVFDLLRNTSKALREEAGQQ